MKTYQSKGAQENHGNDSCLKILVLNQPVRLDAQVSPALPEWRVLVAYHAWKVKVAADGAAVGRIFLL